LQISFGRNIFVDRVENHTGDAFGSDPFDASASAFVNVSRSAMAMRLVDQGSCSDANS
jgi:hypothetical protein